MLYLKKALLFLGFFFITISCTISNRCDKIRTGTFLYKTTEGKVIFIERSNSIQTEYDQKGNILIQAKVFWEPDCHFKLVTITDSLSENPIDSLMASTPLQVEVLTITNKYYTCKGSMIINGKSISRIDTCWIK